MGFEVLAWAVKQEKKIRVTDRMKTSKYHHFQIMQYKKMPKTGLANTFKKMAGYKIKKWKSVDFLYTNNKHAGKEVVKMIPITWLQKNK